MQSRRGAGGPRLDFIDSYRGLACILMFQTHAYDRWTAEASRTGWYWWTSRHVGGFPSRLFLLLAGISLVLRFENQRRKQIAPSQMRREGVKRGFEILVLGILFRFTEWFLGGYQPELLGNIWRVDILNCIGVSMMVCALVTAPPSLERPRRAWPLALAALAVAFATPYVEQIVWPSAIPAQLAAYVAGKKPLAFFPLFPWVSYMLAGCASGIYLSQASARGRLPQAVLVLALIGGAMAIGGQIAHQTHRTFFDFGDRSSPPTSPSAFFYRTGVCLAGAGLLFVLTRPGARGRFSILRQLGRTSLLVYWVHVELVYGHLSDRIDHRLTLPWGTVLLVLLTGAMVLLSWLRTDGLAYLKRRVESAQRSGG